MHAVTLQEEMDFVNSYIYLLQMRYEDNLTFAMHIEPELLSKMLPPMGVQLLIENAVKHNEISNRHPFAVHIVAKDVWLLVSNLLQPKRVRTSGTRVGLDNLAKRYQLLFHKSIEVKEEQNCFIVKLPLI